MIDQLLDILKIAFLVLLYLFFLRVLWVVLTEVRATRSTAQAGGLGAQATHIAPDQLVAEPGPAPVPAPVPVPARAKRAKRGAVARLQIVEPRSRRGTSYGVQSEITLGRSQGCTVQVADDAFISNLHARVYSANGEVYVEDLGSTNGTYVNGAKLEATRPLRRGDRVQLGRTVLEAQ